MTLQTSGAISLANVQTEFGGSNPIGINEYYGADTGVPSSGTISLNNFYGKSNGTNISVTVKEYWFTLKNCVKSSVGVVTLEYVGLENDPACSANSGYGSRSPTSYNGATIQAITDTITNNCFIVSLTGNLAKTFFSSVVINGKTYLTSSLTNAGTDPSSPTDARYYSSQKNMTVWRWDTAGLAGLQNKVNQTINAKIL